MPETIKKIFNVDGKVVVITGGLGILGSVFAKSLADAGAKVAVIEVKEGTLDHENIKVYKTDITKRTSIEGVLDKITKELGVPDALINCAAIDFPPNFDSKGSGLLESNEAEEIYSKVMEVNVKGLLLCAQVFGNVMAKKGRGSIINISSIYGMISPDQRIYPLKNGKKFVKPIAYSVSKSAIFNLTRYLAAYWGKDNVRVNTLTFGGVFNGQDKEFVANYSSKVPLGRMAKQEDYVGAIFYLVSDASSYTTGSNIIIDGGYTAL